MDKRNIFGDVKIKNRWRNHSLFPEKWYSQIEKFNFCFKSRKDFPSLRKLHNKRKQRTSFTKYFFSSTLSVHHLYQGLLSTENQMHCFYFIMLSHFKFGCCSLHPLLLSTSLTPILPIHYIFVIR